ncbi:GntR family transcriptional regulator [Streptomyces iranensis]|uniref:DNA-binding GntR family transcriptional regulator n=1 Tax=Streptomyces iranensis TaxID=576784 RepID=A0A060ZJH5_9ACTN|nr:GntR family transcriptional regulator [Streptomyces iranensis]MBP2068557.1 DNA-binding GntR family transcriptional regulator [Streptomyces iranensis]CDR01305.1 transcriptional regulator, GntR family protein [Streptomyces iranensis]
MAQARTQEQDQLVSSIVDDLQDRIGDGDIKIGSWIRQERIAREYGVSRTPVREALRQLEALGVVEIVANRGARVILPSLQDIAQAFEVRGVLEGHAALLAARNIGQKELDVLHGTDALFQEAAEMAGAQTEEALAQARHIWFQANGTFHTTIIVASGNRQLEMSIEALHHRIPRGLTWTALGGDVRLLKDNAEEHARISAAIEARDEETARDLTIEHSRRAQELIVMRTRDQTSSS